MTQAFPLSWPNGWPRCTARKPAKFNKEERQHSRDGQSSWTSKRGLTVADATKRVIAELTKLNVGHGEAIISTNLKLRLDGLPRSDQAEPADPGAAVYWRDRKGNTKVMAIDRYDRIADNLAAIAATLEAMRAIERHGGAQILDRAFTGFTALPPSKSCWDILGIKVGSSRGDIEAAYRDLAKRHHPDTGGTHDGFVEITSARDRALATASA